MWCMQVAHLFADNRLEITIEQHDRCWFGSILGTCGSKLKSSREKSAQKEWKINLQEAILIDHKPMICSIVAPLAVLVQTSVKCKFTILGSN